MFQDIELSRDFMTGFTEHCSRAKQAAAGSMDIVEAKKNSNIEFHVQVLTTGYWPTPPSAENIILPPELIALQERFMTYYNGKYQGRRIVWAHQLERCDHCTHCIR
jgi:hypothetical protein